MGVEIGQELAGAVVEVVGGLLGQVFESFFWRLGLAGGLADAQTPVVVLVLSGLFFLLGR